MILGGFHPLVRETDVADIPTADWSWINAAADRFERACSRGRRPRIEDYLGDLGPERVPAILDELLRVECELRRRGGEEPTAEEYRARFPDHVGVVDAVFGANPPAPADAEVEEVRREDEAPGGAEEHREGSHPFLSTAADEAAPRAGAGVPRAARDKKVVSFSDARTSQAQDRLGSTATAPPDGAAPLGPSAPDAPGWRVGHYLLVERLGTGAQGHVWRAVQLEPIVRTVALKVLPPGLAPDDVRVNRLSKEARRGGGLSHDAILPVYDFGSSGGYSYLAMQLVEGFPLSNLLARRRAWLAGPAPADLHRLAVLPEAEYVHEIVRLLIRIARALEHAHLHDIVHRDVKPSNILIERENEERVYLSDFGLARDLNDLSTSQSSSWVGTLPYMGPEKLLGARVVDEIRCDVFAMGVTLFEAVTLSRPIELPETMSGFAAAAVLATALPRRPRALKPRLPKDLEAVILKAIDRNPALRYPRAGALADDLDRFLNNEPVHARPLGWTRRTYRRLARHRVAIAVLGAAVLIATTVLLVRLATSIEHAYRAGKYRAHAEERLREGRLDEADELTAVAESLMPGDPTTAELLARLRAERRENLDEEIDRGDVVRAWRDWKKLRPARPDAAEFFDRQVGIQPLRVVSELPGTRVSLHAVYPDGRPRDGAALFELTTGPLDASSEDLARTFRADVRIIPGAYWVTAIAPSGTAFVERPLEVRRSYGFNPTIRLYPKTNQDASAGMVEIPPGTLRMGSNETLPGEGMVRTAPPEFPEHDVPVRGFYLDRTEVTNRAFLEFLTRTGREGWGANIWPESGGRPEPGKLDWPVTRVTYQEAVEFAAWRGCCLPDESQLEWAARGPTRLKTPTNVPADVPPERWTQIHGVESDALDQTELWSQRILGLYGNAGELTLFRFRPYPHPDRTVSGSTSRIGFVARSGAFRDSLSSKIVSLGYLKRASLIPEARDSNVGFRCARSVQTRINLSPQPPLPTSH
jgi:serine/threonine protein kinase/formylglycine-generating enzyme required for sulfatase activity